MIRCPPKRVNSSANVECVNAAIANRMLDDASAPKTIDYNRMINTDVAVDIKSIAHGIALGAQNAELLLSEALQEESLL